MSNQIFQQVFDKINQFDSVVIAQADNPDSDSLGSALALESILDSMGKKVHLYCGTSIPDYLKYLSGWSRVNRELPSKFDLVILVDVSTNALLENIQQDFNYKKFLKTPKIVFDHHKTVNDTIDSLLTVNDPGMSSTGELIYEFSVFNKIQIDIETGEYLMSAILGDTQGLSNKSTSENTYLVMAELVKLGVDRPALEDIRKQYSKMTEPIFRFKASLIKKTNFYCDGKLAVVVVNQKEINEFSPKYNPGALIIPDLLQVEDVEIAVVIKSYDDGRITGAIRSSNSYPIAAKAAEELGGGGHDNASGFKIMNNKDHAGTVNQLVKICSELLK